MLNRYLYVTDDPVNQADPSGNFDIVCLGAFLFFGFAIAFEIHAAIATIVTILIGVAIAIDFIAGFLGPVLTFLAAQAALLIAVAFIVWETSQVAGGLNNDVAGIEYSCSRL